MGQDKKGQQGNTTNTKPQTQKSGGPAPGFSTAGKYAKQWIDRRNDALDFDDPNYGAKSGNPCHYQTHVGEDKMKNRQGRSGGSTCHHGKS